MGGVPPARMPPLWCATSSAAPLRCSGSSLSLEKTVLPCLCLIDREMKVRTIRDSAAWLLGSESTKEETMLHSKAYGGPCASDMTRRDPCRIISM
ncbi:hypothetical protein EMEDMD4_250002 [Sinorhizobium medicae]|uniref:Uncharacterized protein n=1 Tax=Sinorhizobium medicae TaxID=110321 RepID=A0A508WWM0_9HYPH|nr:hypothetical protein EMEDMD4_250002 [Sinorhizobium medicae]